ncbi:MAG: PD40 domain-containing protein [Planctomycetes bacterium]|nr:PD40 domain-containing protein [Planctomycetota bacterium]
MPRALSAFLVLAFLASGCKLTPNVYSFAPDGRLAVCLGPEGRFEFLTDATSTEVYVADPELETLRRLTTRESFKSWVSFSPDGGRLLYVEDLSTLREIGADGSDDRVLCSLAMEEEVWFPRHAPRAAGAASDSGWVAYHRTADLTTPGAVEVLDTADPEAGPRRLVASALPRYAWSPDGTAVAAVVADREAQESLYEGRLVVARVETREQETILQGHFGVLTWVDWSPDGASLLLTRADPEGLSLHLVRVRLADGEVTELPRAEAATDFYPSFSPDGERVFWTRSTEEDSSLAGRPFLMDLEGGEPQLLAFSRAPATAYPVWVGPRRLAFVAGETGMEGLWSYDLEKREATDVGARLQRAFAKLEGR